MGFYLETYTHHGKAAVICERYDGEEITPEEAEFYIREGIGAVICVVDNGPFEAAAFCYNLNEFRTFTHPDDNRPHTWLYVDDRARVEQDTGFARAHS